MIFVILLKLERDFLIFDDFVSEKRNLCCPCFSNLEFDWWTNEIASSKLLETDVVFVCKDKKV